MIVSFSTFMIPLSSLVSVCVCVRVCMFAINNVNKRVALSFRRGKYLCVYTLKSNKIEFVFGRLKFWCVNVCYARVYASAPSIVSSTVCPCFATAISCLAAFILCSSTFVVWACRGCCFLCFLMFAYLCHVRVFLPHTIAIQHKIYHVIECTIWQMTTEWKIQLKSNNFVFWFPIGRR